LRTLNALEEEREGEDFFSLFIFYSQTWHRVACNCLLILFLGIGSYDSWHHFMDGGSNKMQHNTSSDMAFEPQMHCAYGLVQNTLCTFSSRTRSPRTSHTILLRRTYTSYRTCYFLGDRIQTLDSKVPLEFWLIWSSLFILFQ
jgi:hypothetical protein